MQISDSQEIDNRAEQIDIHMTGEGITNTPSAAETPVTYPIPPNSSLTDRIYGIFQIQDVSMIEEIAESDNLE